MSSVFHKGRQPCHFDLHVTRPASRWVSSSILNACLACRAARRCWSRSLARCSSYACSTTFIRLS